MLLVSGNYREKLYRVGKWELFVHCEESVPLPEIAEMIECGTSASDLIYANVWYHPDRQGFFRQQFMECIQTARAVFPEALRFFYQTLQDYNVSFLPPEQHCNRYYRHENLMLADFPYAEDQFFMLWDPEKRTVWLYGRPECLRRILSDLQSISWSLLPIHGAAAQKDGKATCILGNTNSGKSFLLQILMKQGYSYLADDALYIKNDKIHRMDEFISLREGETKSLQKINPASFEDAGAEVSKIWILEDLAGREFLQWFPCVAKQSFWWYDLLDFTPERKNEIQAKVAASAEYVKRMLEKGCFLRLDLQEAKRQLDGHKFSEEKLFCKPQGRG